MARKKQGRFSRYIRPLTYLIDLYIINFFATNYIFNNEPFFFFLLVSATWITISIFCRFYNIYRYTPEIRILNLLLVQCLLFLMAIFSVSGIFPFLSIFIMAGSCYFSANKLYKIILRNLFHAKG